MITTDMGSVHSASKEFKNMILDYLAAFREWCALKIALWRKQSRVVFKQGDIWWCCLGMNIGEEAFGKGERFTRPILIFKKFTGNSFLGLPLTMREKRGSWYVEIETRGVIEMGDVESSENSG